MKKIFIVLFISFMAVSAFGASTTCSSGSGVYWHSSQQEGGPGFGPLDTILVVSSANINENLSTPPNQEPKSAYEVSYLENQTQVIYKKGDFRMGTSVYYTTISIQRKDGQDVVPGTKTLEESVLCENSWNRIRP
jgi:hypothetical protein